MADTIIIVPNISDDEARHFIDASDEYSPLRYVAFHVAKRQIARAYAIVAADSAFPSDSRIMAEAERELVARYVGEDFCGLCGRYTDHQGEH